MEILSVNANQKLVNVAASIGRDPYSWEGWLSLFIPLSNLSDDLHQECLLWKKSIVDSYLKDIEGRVYFTSDKNIHIISKLSMPQILHQTGQQICDMVEAENALSISYMIYDLPQDGFFYAEGILAELANAPTTRAVFKPGKTLLQHIEDHNASKFTNAIKVLLIEDDPVTRWLVRNALKNECELATASSANKAFGMYSACQPDIVFLDINLPDGNGYDVLDWIMHNDPGACVVMFSSNDNLDNIASAIEFGASGFIAKPFLKKNLLHYIQCYSG